MSNNSSKFGLNRRNFLKTAATASLASMVGLPSTHGSTVRAAQTAKDSYKMVFVQFQPHTVSSAWGKGIEEVLKTQQNISFELLDGQAKVDVQIGLMDNAISQGVDAIFLQPVDSVAVGPSILKAKEAGIPVLTLNIDSTEAHAAHVEMNHYYGAIAIGEKMGEMMGGKGNVVILNAPPGIIIRDQRTNGFKKGLEKYPDIKVVADQSADWDRKKAQDVLSALMVSNKDINGVYGVNDSMALGAVDVLKAKDLVGKVVVFGNDGEKDALEAIQAGTLSGTQYTDVFQQGRFAASIAVALATGGVGAKAFQQQARLLMPYFILTKDNVGQIQPNQRW
jgi:ABC-type sugar transport system substrate-binding protein